MKKILKVVGVALCLVAFTQNSNAQFNVGLDVSMPIGTFGDGFGIGFGGSAGYDHAIGDNMKIGGQVGLLRFGGKTDDNVSPMYKDYKSSTSLMLIPILGNFKYYFSDNTNGFYSSVSIGMSMYNYKNETTYTVSEWAGWAPGTYNAIYEDVEYSYDNSFNKTYLTYAVGVGYLINEKMDFGLRYTIVAGQGGSLAHANLRVAYNF